MIHSSQTTVMKSNQLSYQSGQDIMATKNTIYSHTKYAKQTQKTYLKN